MVITTGDELRRARVQPVGRAPRAPVSGARPPPARPARPALTGVLRVDEVHPRPGRAVARLVVEQAQTLRAQSRARCLDVGDAIGHLLDARAVALEETSDRRRGAQWREQLDLRAAV